MIKIINKIFIFTGMTIGSYIGWWIGSFIGIMTALLFSSVCSLLGVYIGWSINRKYF